MELLTGLVALACVFLGGRGTLSAFRLRNPNGVRQIATPGGWFWVWTFLAPFVVFGSGNEGLLPLVVGLAVGWLACIALGRALVLAGILKF